MAGPPQPERKKLANQGKALPDKDGSGGRFPIRNRSDLQKAIKAVGRVKPATDEARAKVRRHIMSRARALSLSNLIPKDWAPDGTLKTGGPAPSSGGSSKPPPFVKSK